MKVTVWFKNPGIRSNGVQEDSHTNVKSATTKLGFYVVETDTYRTKYPMCGVIKAVELNDPQPGSGGVNSGDAGSPEDGLHPG